MAKEIHKYGTDDGWHGVIEEGSQFPPEAGRYHLYIGMSIARCSSAINFLLNEDLSVRASVVARYLKLSALNTSFFYFPNYYSDLVQGCFALLHIVQTLSVISSTSQTSSRSRSQNRTPRATTKDGQDGNFPIQMRSTRTPQLTTYLVASTYTRFTSRMTRTTKEDIVFHCCGIRKLERL